MKPLLWQEILVDELENGLPTGEKYLDWTVYGQVRDLEAAEHMVEQLVTPNPRHFGRTNRFVFMEFTDLDGDGIAESHTVKLLGPKGEVQEPEPPAIAVLERAAPSEAPVTTSDPTVKIPRTENQDVKKK